MRPPLVWGAAEQHKGRGMLCALESAGGWNGAGVPPVCWGPLPRAKRVPLTPESRLLSASERGDSLFCEWLPCIAPALEGGGLATASLCAGQSGALESRAGAPYPAGRSSDPEQDLALGPEVPALACERAGGALLAWPWRPVVPPPDSVTLCVRRGTGCVRGAAQIRTEPGVRHG